MHSTTTLRPAVLADVTHRSTAMDAVLVVAGAVLVAVSAQVVIPLPLTPVPITGSTFGVLLAAAALGPARGGLAMGLYLALGAAGLPVFLGGNAGFTYALGATGGYIVGYVPAAVLVGALARRGLDRHTGGSLAAFAAGSLVIYAFGVPWLAFALDVSAWEAIALGAAPFLLGDAIKAVLAAVLLPTTWRLIGR